MSVFLCLDVIYKGCHKYLLPRYNTEIFQMYLRVSGAR